MAQQKNDTIIKSFSPRDYQRNIVDVCIQRNSIVYLPTGAGKTYISIQVIKHFSSQLKGKYSKGAKRSIFLVDKCPLAEQQGDDLKLHLSYNVGIVTGDTHKINADTGEKQNIDTFNEDDWLKILDKNEVLVMTAQCFKQAVHKTLIKLQQINVIVFDECHHTRGNHMYHQITQSFKQLNEHEIKEIRIIGLSGMLIGVDNSVKEKTVATEMSNLESSLQSTIITVHNIEDQKNVLIYSTKAKESVEHFNSSLCFSKPLTEVIFMLDDLKENLCLVKEQLYKKKIKELINIFNDFYSQQKQYKGFNQVEQMGNFGGYLALLSILIQLELKKRTAGSEKFKQIIKICITKVEQCVRKMKSELFPYQNWSENIVFSNSSNKVQKLIKLLQHFFSEHKSIKDYQCIIFVKQRSTAKILYHIIKTLASCIDNFPLCPDFVVGHNRKMPESIEAILNESQKNANKDALGKFKNKQTNCIVCTDVLEEGIDVQACNLVIMFDPPTTPRSYIQSRGRARNDESDYWVMIEDDPEVRAKFEQNMKNWKIVHEEMKRQLIGKTLDRPPPSEEQIEEEQQQSWEPFITASGAELNALNAISILNDYCMTLPLDRYTIYRVNYRRIDHSNGTFQFAIQMPISSMILDEIYGEPMKNSNLAKQHAAFETCKLLLGNGSLTDKLIPLKPAEKIEEYDGEYFAHWSKYTSDEEKNAGTKNNYRNHSIKIPDALRDCSPSSSKQNFVYRINITPEFKTQNDFHLNVFHQLIGNENSYGILTTKEIPCLCKIPLFQSFGKVSCEISQHPKIICIENENKINSLRQFHINIFRDVLKVLDFCVIDKSSYLIVPLNEQNEINWSLIDRFQEIPKPVQLTYDQIKSMDFTPDNYMDKILNPVYKSNNDNYIVVDVLNDKSPLSPFPDQSKIQGTTFADYYCEKYDQTIHHQSQFLLAVKGLSKDFNLFFPKSNEKEKLKNDYFEELIPELCHIYEFPSDYWIKAKFLPAVCHRLQHLLNAEELRNWLISVEVDLGKVEQIYELDIDYEKKLKERKKTAELGELPNFDEKLQDQREKEEKIDYFSEKSLCKKQFDLDRDLENVTDADLDNFTFRKAPSFNLQSTNTFLPAIKDSVTSAEIKLIHLSNKSSSVQQKDLIKVLTTAHSGDVFNMERFETLGDAFLKFIVSLFLYKTHENLHQGHLTALKGKMVSNRNLFYIGNDFGLSKMIRICPFYSNGFLTGPPPCCKISASILEHVTEKKTLLNRLIDIPLTNDEMQSGIVNEANLNKFLKVDRNQSSTTETVNKQMLLYLNENCIGDKTVADAVEALIGCVVSSTGPLSALKLCQKLKIIPENDQKLLKDKILPRTPYSVTSAIINVEKLEEILRYKFDNQIYLNQALTHSSYPIKDVGSYENLEFLGDAVLDFLVTSYICEQCPNMDPGKLTDLRSALVNNVTLACIVVRNEIHKFLKAESRTLYETIKKFVDFQIKQDNKVTDEVFLITEYDETSTAMAINIPKVLGDIFESMIGAVFLDSNFSFAKTWSVIYNLMEDEIKTFMTNVPLQVVRRLYEHDGGKAEPMFYESRVLNETEEVAVPLQFKLHGEEKIVIGVGKNQKIAKKAAAKRALVELEKNII